MSRNVQFVTDADGNKVAVILPIEEYEEMMEDLQIPNKSTPPGLEEKLAAMREAASDELYLADLNEATEDFKHTDAEIHPA
jgi:PHD/YefM family antitoxin component YafN of YafNO toxin-antitoxin module